MRPTPLLLVCSLLLCAPLLASCSTPYYWTMEKLGIEKRDILVDRVEEGREAQTEAKEQFRSALEAFRALTAFDGGDLAEVYDRLSDEYEASAERAEEVTSRIDSIERVAGDLFEEWQGELGEMQNPELKAQSRTMLGETKARYAELVAAMRKAEASMQPVLVSFHDHVLALKHNLNARAIASLSGELKTIEGSVDALIADMEASIAEADAFLATLN